MNLSFYEGLQNVVELSVVVFLPICLEKQLALHINLHMDILVGSLETIMFYLCQSIILHKCKYWMFSKHFTSI